VRRFGVLVGVLMLTCGLSVRSSAKEEENSARERVYDAPFDKVWAACVQAANEKFALLHSEKASGVLTFENGKAASYGTHGIELGGISVGVTVTSVNDNKTKVVLNPQKKRLQFASSATGPIGKKFFEAVELLLKAQ
jgi:hypothetical protein